MGRPAPRFLLFCKINRREAKIFVSNMLRNTVRAILWFYILTALITVGFWILVINHANNSIGENARMVAYAVSEEGCLPEGETVSYHVYKNGRKEEVSYNYNGRTTYTKAFKSALSSQDNLLNIFVNYGDDCIKVTNLDTGGQAFSYDTAAQRGRPVKVTITGHVNLPLPFYPVWEGWPDRPSVLVDISKSITVYTYKYQRE